MHLTLPYMSKCDKNLIYFTHLLLEPLDGLVASNLVGRTDTSGSSSALGDTATGTVKNDVEVHSVNSDGGIVPII